MHPAWVHCHVIDHHEPWYAETDEETFRPWTEQLPVDPAVTMFLVRARFTTRGGLPLEGFITPHSTTSSVEMSAVQPHLFLPSGVQVGFGVGILKRLIEERQRLLTDALHEPTTKLFPIRFVIDPGLAVGLQSGTIDGFSSWEPKARRTRTE